MSKNLKGILIFIGFVLLITFFWYEIRPLHNQKIINECKDFVEIGGTLITGIRFKECIEMEGGLWFQATPEFEEIRY
jgi:hypothetical protein